MSSIPPTDKDYPPSGEPESSGLGKRRRPKTPPHTVPPTDHQQSIHDTPAVARSAHSATYWDGTLEQKRMTLLEDLGYAIAEESINDFFEFFLPPLKAGINVDAVMTSLRTDKTVNKDGTWASFSKKNGEKKSENEKFSELEGIFNKVAEHARQTSNHFEPTFVLRLLPNTVPESERGSTTKPDGYFVPKGVDDANRKLKTTVYRWYDIALTCEFKLHDTLTARDDDVSKVVFSMQHTMTVDPCRRFTFGISIEGTTIRLWFCSRAIMVVSEPFDIGTQPELLVHVFLSLGFATKTELGWDPTIEVVDPDAEKRVYRIQVGEKEYEVIATLSDFGADAIIGRASRVFKAKDLVSGEECVLKDVWVEVDRKLEHETYALILDDVEKKFGKDAREIVSKHFLKPSNHWLVHVDGQEDHTKDIMMRGHSPLFKNTFLLKADEPGNKDSIKSVSWMRTGDTDGYDDLNTHLGSRLAPALRGGGLRHRRHYRVVFKQVAEPIWALTILSQAFVVLRDCLIALEYMHKSGWIHRDISAGNIYWFEGRGLLGDLEYAKKMGEEGTHQMRTGTPDFMAVEVMKNDWAFLSPELSTGSARSAAHESNKKYRRTTEATNPRPPRPEPDSDPESDPESQSQRRGEIPPFSHNEAHDVESLWWISIYLLFFKGDVALADKQTTEVTKERGLRNLQIFPSAVIGSSNRDSFLRNGRSFKEYTSWFPAPFNGLKSQLNLLRLAIVASYSDFERAFPTINKAAFKTIYGSGIDDFEACISIARGIKVQSYKVLGRRREKELSQPERPDIVPGVVSSPREISALDQTRKPTIIKDAPRAAERKLRLRRPVKRQA